MSQESIKETLTAAIGAFTETPEAAKVVFRADTELVEDLKCKIAIRDFDPIMIDEPAELGGTNTAANPLEVLVGALGTCQEIIYNAYASVMGIQIDELKVEVKGYCDLRGLLSIDEKTPSGFSKIQYVTTIKSPADIEAIKQLVAVTESHCPVLDTLVRPIEVTGEVTANGEKIH